MAHEAGRLISTKIGLPHVMDMRDPWSLVQRLLEHTASPFWFVLAARYERRAVLNASLIVANTEVLKQAMARLYPAARSRMITVMNGYDDEPVPETSGDGRFVITYAGTIYIDRDPSIVLRAASRVIAELQLTPAEFELRFIGNVERYGGVSLLELARQEAIEDFLVTQPRMSRAELRAVLAEASMLLSLPQDDHMAVPSKVFEYMPFSAWVLSLAEQGSATEFVLRATGADVVAPEDVDGLAGVLKRRYLMYSQGLRPEPVARRSELTRESQAQILLDALERLDAGHGY
jgi:hypothetical protein